MWGSGNCGSHGRGLRADRRFIAMGVSETASVVEASAEKPGKGMKARLAEEYL